MTVLFQCKLWLLPALFISQSPAHDRVYRDARSRDRERGLSKLSGVDVLYIFIVLRDPIGSFSDWHCAALRPSEGPQRSALVLRDPIGSFSDGGSATAQRGPTAERPCLRGSHCCQRRYNLEMPTILCYQL